TVTTTASGSERPAHPAPAGESRRRAALRLLADTAILFVGMNHDLFHLLGRWRSSYIGYDSYLVLTRMQMSLDGSPAWHPMWVEKLSRHYVSQFGLQAITLGAVLKAAGAPPVPFALTAASLAALATAGLLALFFASVA